MGRVGVVPSAGRTESWPCAASALLEVFASDLKSGFTGCLGAGSTAAVAKPDGSPPVGCTPLSVLAASWRATGNLRPPSFTGFASPAVLSASAAEWERAAVRTVLPGTGLVVADGLRSAARNFLPRMGLSPGPSTRI